MSISRNEQSTIDLIRKLLREAGIESTVQDNTWEVSPKINLIRAIKTTTGIIDLDLEILISQGTSYGIQLTIGPLAPFYPNEEDLPALCFFCGLIEKDLRLIRFRTELNCIYPFVPLYFVEATLTRARLMYCINELVAFMEVHYEALHSFHMLHSPEVMAMNATSGSPGTNEWLLDALPADLVQQALELKQTRAEC